MDYQKLVAKFVRAGVEFPADSGTILDSPRPISAEADLVEAAFRRFTVRGGTPRLRFESGMTMAEVLNVEVRKSYGKRHAKRLRNGGAIPAVLYGHGEQTVSLAVSRDQFATAMRHGSRLVELKGGVNESALIRDLQWDTYGTGVLHIDFTRVSADERIEVTVPVELRGQAPGARQGGVVQHLAHEIKIECLATAIPDKIQLNINHLEIGGSVTIGQLELPQGAKLLSDPDAVAAQCVEPAAEVEEAAATTEGAEPEVIGRKAETEEEEEK